MRTTFIKKLIELADNDPNIYLLIGDYGYSIVEPFRDKFPNRFINVGICEQNMIGVAAGLALTGKKIFVYSIASFITMRCFEQIRIDLCYQNLPVRIIGISGGLAFGSAATTHHTIEDFALMCSLPNMSVVCPANSFEVQELLPQINQLPGPAYLRLGRGGSGAVYPIKVSEVLGENIEIIPNDKNLFLVTGELYSMALQVVQRLKNFGIDCGLVMIHTLKPLNLDCILFRANTLNSIFTLEEHGEVGGIGQQVASFLCQKLNKKILFRSFCLPDAYFHEAGSREYLLNHAGLEVDLIYTDVLNLLTSMVLQIHNEGS